MDAEIKIAGYENIYVDCPYLYCKKENIFNRISDLHNNDCISRLDNIKCQFCGQDFSIIGDTITNAKFRWFMDELPIFKKRKEYRLYILNLCQGIECFFSQAIINKLIYRNSDLRDEAGKIILEKWNKARNDLDKKTVYDLIGKDSNELLKTKKDKRKEIIFKKASFDQLCQIFRFQYGEEKEKVNDNGNLSKMKEDKRKEFFELIEKTKVNEMRNKIIHKQ
ncbi:MAG: hypothetical protein KAS78_00425, partial [Candidatus Pacebacteria bacterium]|nr:hypothetical protein [Candidatus Paceibacterota bacterium]